MVKLHSPNFNLERTLMCGQAFRWRKENSSFAGVVGSFAVRAHQENDELYIFSNNNDAAFWRHYFDLTRDYPAILAKLRKHPALRIAIENSSDIHILRQDAWETLCSFIISQQNNIPRIQLIISRLCENFGSPIDDVNYAFPTAQQLIGQDLSSIKAGFREKYILAAAKFWLEHKIDENDLYASLKQIYGVGDKIANCVALFAYGRFDAFPEDVWVKKITAMLHINKTDFGENAGLAQQYLYHYYRNGGGVLHDYAS